MVVDDAPLSAVTIPVGEPAPAVGPGPVADQADHGALILTVFSVLWALSVLLHVYASPALDGVLHGGGGLPGAAAVVVAAAGLALLALPGRSAPLVVLSAAAVVSAVADAPVVGNHWVLQALVSLGLLGAATETWRTGRRDGTAFSRERFAALALPLVRWSLLCFYGFAAFSKVNTAFLDPVVSCANVFADGTLRSFGLPGNLTGGSGWLPRALPVTAMVVELAVPVLVVMRRTRPYGIALALVFHSLVSADRDHPIGDFGSYLLASFVLFLPESFFVDVGRWARARLAWAQSIAAAVLFVAATLVLLQADGRRAWGRTVLAEGRWALWIGLDLVILVSVLGWLARRRFRFEAGLLAGGHRPAAGSLRWPAQARWLLVIPALIVLNGLTPYLEVKTGYSWNMYSNLRTVDGDSNHLVVRQTLPLTDQQEDMVTIHSSSDPGLQQYANRGFALPMLQLRAYLADRPDVAIRFSRGAETFDLARAAELPELVRPVAMWQQRLFAFRASTVSGAGPEECQPTWLAAH